jgi:FixJ family two-component response regulator
MIAIVDDDDGVRRATSRLLRSLGHGVVTYATAQDFLNSEHLSTISCLIADVQMPGINGNELQMRLKASGHNFPVIVITAFPEDRVRERALQLGAYAFLTKPFEQAALTDCLGRALKSVR